MNWPFDDTSLKTVERNGIEIDWCETCKGVWLERGELDKILDRVSSEHSQELNQFQKQTSSREYRDQRFEHDNDRGRSYPKGDYKKKKKSGILSELFEF